MNVERCQKATSRLARFPACRGDDFGFLDLIGPETRISQLLPFGCRVPTSGRSLIAVANPGRKIPSSSECRAATDRCNHRARDDRTDARHDHDSSMTIIIFCQRLDLIGHDSIRSPSCRQSLARSATTRTLCQCCRFSNYRSLPALEHLSSLRPLARSARVRELVGIGAGGFSTGEIEG